MDIDMDIDILAYALFTAIKDQTAKAENAKQSRGDASDAYRGCLARLKRMRKMLDIIDSKGAVPTCHT